MIHKRAQKLAAVFAGKGIIGEDSQEVYVDGFSNVLSIYYLGVFSATLSMLVVKGEKA